METLERLLAQHTRLNKWLTIKLIVDLWCQSLLAATVLFLVCIQEGERAFTVFYFGIGGYQVFSTVLHFCFNTIHPLRSHYHWQLISYAILFGLITMGFLTSYLTVLIFFMFILLVLSPFSAIFYFALTIKEYTHLTTHISHDNN